MSGTPVMTYNDPDGAPTSPSELSPLPRLTLSESAMPLPSLGRPTISHEDIARNAHVGDVAQRNIMARTASQDIWPSNKLLSAVSGRGSSTPSTAPSSPRMTPKAATLNIAGVTSSKKSLDGRIADSDIGSKLVIVMVGLPARGKSYIVKKMSNYTRWLGHKTQIFNVGERRRVAHLIPEGTSAGLNSNGPTTNEQDASFFDPNNTAAVDLREQVAMETLNDLLDFIQKKGGAVGIFDATNHTMRRRAKIVEQIRLRFGKELKVMFVESICNDQKVLEANMRLKLQGPDYKDRDPVEALADFKRRVANYQLSYENLGEIEEKLGYMWIQCHDVGRKFVQVGVKEWGFLGQEVANFLISFHLSPRQIWVSRHGQTYDNVLDKIGGDSVLNERGRRFARALPSLVGLERSKFYEHQLEKHLSLRGDLTPPAPEHIPFADAGEEEEAIPPAEKNFCVWASKLERARQTVGYFDDETYSVKFWRLLNEICAGKLEGMTYQEIKEKYPAEYEARRRDKLSFKYPGAGGESYLDVINRMKQIIMEVERMTENVMLVGHRVIVRILLAYFMGFAQEDVPQIDVPLDLVYCIEPKPYGNVLKVWKWDEHSDSFEYIPNYKVNTNRTRHDGE